MIKSVEDVLSNMQVQRPMPTGMKFLDEHLGGLYPGEITVICGDANDGKTALMIKMIHRLVFDEDIPVLMVLNGTSEQSFLSCMAAYYSNVICKDVQELIINESDVSTYWQLLRTKPLYFASERVLDEEWTKDTKEDVNNKGIKAIFLEKSSYMHSLCKYEKRAGEVLKNLAKELQVAVVAEYEIWWNYRARPFYLYNFSHDNLNFAGISDNVLGIVDLGNHGIYSDEKGNDVSGLVRIFIMKHKGVESLRKEVFFRKILLLSRNSQQIMDDEASHMMEYNPYLQELIHKFDCELSDEECL